MPVNRPYSTHGGWWLTAAPKPTPRRQPTSATWTSRARQASKITRWRQEADPGKTSRQTVYASAAPRLPRWTSPASSASSSPSRSTIRSGDVTCNVSRGQFAKFPGANDLQDRLQHVSFFLIVLADRPANPYATLRV